ncbi:MAG: exodeoxyribonuclease VII large subunit [Armatimonadetes bacterium]|nr:exodeoxyribonuclease VII large subunit [Armatimonadota bacterium]
MTGLDPFLHPLTLGGGSEAALSIGQFTEHLAAVLREDEILQDVWVRGEIARCTRAASGHLYFSLKDDQASLDAVLWRRSAERLSFRPEPGLQVRAHGHTELYAPRGQYQFIVDTLEPDGLGALYLQLERTRQRLTTEGLLAPERKKPLPAFPRRVAVITSLAGAAVQDICATLLRDPHPVEIVLVPTLVQGDAAPASLCRALQLADAWAGADLLIVGRGGGSIQDLWCFNDETLARTLCSLRTPVLSAVGHETDFTLSDLAADGRALTPTAAAEWVLAARGSQRERHREAMARIESLFLGRLELARLRWEGLCRRGPLAYPDSLLSARRQRLDELTARLGRAREVCLFRWQQRLALAAGRLDGLSPLATLARGYSVVSRLPDDLPVTSVAQVVVGQDVRVRLADGAFQARVLLVEEVGR